MRGFLISSTILTISFSAPPMTPDHCKNSLQMAVHLCEGLGFPVAPEKAVGPTTTLIFLGIELDSVKMEMRLPREKLERLQISLGRWLDKDSTTKRQLQSIIGQLSDAAIVVRPGRTFLRSLIKTSTIPKKQDHKVRSARRTSTGGRLSLVGGMELPYSLVAP